MLTVYVDGLKVCVYEFNKAIETTSDHTIWTNTLVKACIFLLIHNV